MNNRKQLYIKRITVMFTKDMVVFIGLGIVFLVVSFLVFITRGNNSYLLRKKLRIGAVIISLSLSLGFTATGCDNNTVACYSESPGTTVIFSLDEDTDGVIEFNNGAKYTLSGVIEYGADNDYAYTLYSDSTQEQVAAGTIIALDGAFDSSSEEIELSLPESLPVGSYTLSINKIYNNEIIKTIKFSIVIMPAARIELYDLQKNTWIMEEDFIIESNGTEDIAIWGSVSHVGEKEYFYTLTDERTGEKIVENNLGLEEYDPGTGMSVFTIVVPGTVQQGQYTLRFYQESISDNNEISRFTVITVLTVPQDCSIVQRSQRTSVPPACN